MISSGLDIYHYTLPFGRPVRIREHVLKNRSGIIIILKDELDNFGAGEIAPLPGLHSESLKDVLNQLKNLKKQLIGTKINIENTQNAFICFELLKKDNLYPSVSFGLESAICNLLCMRREIELNKLISKNAHNEIAINALLHANDENLEEQIQQLIREGFEAVKLKVGRHDIHKEIRFVRQVGEWIDGKANIRLDANRAWTLKQAVEFAKGIDGISVDYIEEPLSDFSAMKSFYERTNLAVALDESMTDISFNILKGKTWLKAVIIKPPVVGGIQKTFELIDWAEQQNIFPVISDVFFSGVGLSMLINIAACVKKKIPMGLETYNRLQEDLLQKRIEFSNGKIRRNENKKGQMINFELLKKIDI